MSFLCWRMLSHPKDRARSSVTWKELVAEPLLLHINRSQVRWLGNLCRMPPGRLLEEVIGACPTRRRSVTLDWSGSALGFPKLNWRKSPWRQRFGHL